MMKIPFWKESYKDDTISTFGNEPNQSLVEILPLLDKNIKILDVGCGDGKNSIYLAKQGFSDITAFDISENAIDKLKRITTKNNLQINAFVDDICMYEFKNRFDLIFSFGTLHFITKDSWRNFICKAKENTNSGGIHIMQIFTDEVPPSADIAPFAVGLAFDNEIKELYSDWEIIDFKSYIFEDEHPNVPKHLHASNKIVAKRIGGAEK